MLELRRHADLGRFDHNWLNARYHFSFAGYYDPRRQGLGPLRVWNDDTIAAGGGFELHGHRDMEIITYVRNGAITHRDHLGNEGVTRAGDVQVMSAGKGILHEEYNRENEPTEIFQIWVEPAATGLKPQWQTRRFPKAARAGNLALLASGRDGDRGALPIHQDAAILAATLTADQQARHELGDRKAYLVVASGRIDVNGVVVAARDGLAVVDEACLTITPLDDSEILLADLP